MRNKKKKHKLNLLKFIPFVLVLAIIAAGAITVLSPEELEGQKIIYAPEESVKTVSVCCVGDIMTHAPQVIAAYNGDGSYYEVTKGSYTSVKTDGSFDFLSNFEYVTKYFDQFDLVMGNIETTFSGDQSYTGYPGFDAPDDLAKAVKAAGLDVALFANNHMLDTKLAGAKRTVQVLRDQGLTVVGARTDTSENRSAVIEKNGLKIGLVAYTYETPLVDGKRTLNGSAGTGMNAGAPDYINTFRYDSKSVKEIDKTAIADEITWCRNEGAQIVICYLHWGNEYQTTPSKLDSAFAQFLAESGADIIFASHPHILQKIDTIEVEMSYPKEWSSQEYPKLSEMPERTKLQQLKLKLGVISEPQAPKIEVEIRPTTWTKTVPVFYSMGNFVSNQRTETLADVYGADTARKTEQGMIACVELSYNEANGNITYNEIDCVPTWVDKYTSGKNTIYKVIPLLDDLDSNKTLKESGHLSRAKAALTEVTKLLSEKYIRKH